MEPKSLRLEFHRAYKVRIQSKLTKKKKKTHEEEVEEEEDPLQEQAHTPARTNPWQELESLETQVPCGFFLPHQTATT